MLYKRGDLVWAKMKGFPPWPGIITAPPPELRKQPQKKSTLYYCIFFFGTKNYSWIESQKLQRYKKGSGLSGGKRSSALREAVTAIESYIETGEGASSFNITPEDDAFDKLIKETREAEVSKTKEKSKKLDDSDDDMDTLSDVSSGIESVKEFNISTEKSDSIDKPSDTSGSSEPVMITDVETQKDETAKESETNSPSEPEKVQNSIILTESEKEKEKTPATVEESPSTPTQPSKEGVETSKKIDINKSIDLTDDNDTTNIKKTPKTNTPSSEFKHPPSTKHSLTHSSGKKKHFQQIVRARPFRQLTKPRITERKSISHSSTNETSGESSGKKRSSSSTTTQDNSEQKKKKRQLYSDADTTTPMVHPNAHSYARRGPAAHLFDRPPNITRPDTPPLDLFSVSQTLLDKHITPSPLRFGFLGLGIMGSGMVKNLLNSGHRVIVWNRTPEKCREFAKVGAEMAVTPQDVCAAADITFSCVAGPKAAKDMVFGNCGALSEMNASKAYVEMTNIDKETSLDIAEAINARGARYLEAQIQGSKAEADEGTLVILTAGDRSLYTECHSCFEAFGRSSFFLGEVGNATKMNLIIQMVAGTTLAGLAEGLALADRCGLQQSDILEVINMTSLRCPMIAEKGKCMTDCSFPTSLPLSHMQKDLQLGLNLGDELEQPLPMTAMANEMYKHSKRLGYGEHDVSAVYIRAKF